MNTVVKTVSYAKNRTDAAKLLVRWAIRTWRTRYPTSNNDDCAVICIFLKHPLLSTPPSIDGARHPPKPRQRSHSESFKTVRSGESSETKALGVNKDDWTTLEGISRAKAGLHPPPIKCFSNSGTNSRHRLM
ncbi:putative protein phosphatase 2C 18 [Platanthera guangdongensis]|uniref:Uncharacterized protein n=1 Tax=Platanthera guangdongensis TaxID=2320717 RepID=A0ABR2LUE3_9ASPA